MGGDPQDSSPDDSGQGARLLNPLDPSLSGSPPATRDSRTAASDMFWLISPPQSSQNSGVRSMTGGIKQMALDRTAPPEAPTSSMDAGSAAQLPTDGSSGASKSRKGYTRQRQGCLTCRRRKKKCDRCYPVCGHCLRLNLACEREEPRRVAGPVADVNKSESEPSRLPEQHHGHVARIYASIDDAVLRDETARSDLMASRRSILRYYTQCFAELLSTNHENNCFLSVMLPMAFECSTLMKSLVAWASSNLAARDAHFQHVALQHRGSALNALKASINQNELTSEMYLAVAMVFCSMESISDTGGSWYHHLVGGAAALGRSTYPLEKYSQLNITALSSVEGQWLLRNYAYHDALMSVTLDCRPLIGGQYWAPMESGQADPYFGLASRIVYLISRISSLNSNLAEQTDSSSQDLGINHTAMMEPGIMADGDCPRLHPNSFADALEIESELLNWSCPHGFSDSPLRLLAESYRSAALIHLYRTLRRHFAMNDDLSAKILQQVGYICDLATQMPDGCLAECTLLFPLFIAGGEAAAPAQIEIIRNKMETINQFRHFKNVDQALEVLNDLWRLRHAGVASTSQREVDWLDITKSRDMKLAIT